MPGSCVILLKTLFLRRKFCFTGSADVMSIQDAVYRALRESENKYLSGQALSAALHVSRNAVWKAVSALRREGFGIEASTRLGYRLISDPGRFSAADICAALRHSNIFPEVYETLPSTNAELKRRAALGAPDGLLLAARQQSAGRGRYGRTFFSPEDSGAYFSLLLRPDWPLSRLRCVTPAAALAAAQMIEAVSGKTAQIKWVNDVYVDGRKVVGILTELATGLESGAVESLVCGFGVNLYPPKEGFPPQLQETAGTVFASKPARDLRAQVIAGICDRFLDALSLAETELLAQYRQRSLLDGQEIWVLRGGRKLCAQALGIGEDFSLHIRRADGGEEAVQVGEVHIRPV